MKTILTAVACTVLVACVASGAEAANGLKEPAVSQSGGRTFLDSQITLGTGFPPISNRSFLSMPVLQLTKGMVLPAKGVIGRLGMDRMLSLRQTTFTIGPRTLSYPVVALMRCSNFPDTGSFVKVVSSTTVLKADAKAGDAIHAGGFVIEARRAVKAGEKVPTLRIVFAEKYFIFSVEEAAPASAGGPQKQQPSLTIAQESATPHDREIAMEAWKLANESVQQNILGDAGRDPKNAANEEYRFLLAGNPFVSR